MGQRSTVQSKAIAAAGNYTANDILSESATNGEGTAFRFSNVGPSGKSITIASSFVSCSEDSVTARLRLHLFRENPSNSELDDNAAKNFAAADRAKVVGYIDFAALSDQGAISYAVGSSNPLEVRLLSSDLWGVLETLDAEANETAGMTVEITLNSVWT